MNSIPIVLFGAFDRHNLGDFLLGRAAASRVAPRPCLFAGLRAVDFRAQGGFLVEPIGQLLVRWSQRFGDVPMELAHVGGEILDTDAWEAAVMLLGPGEATRVIKKHDLDSDKRLAWAAHYLGHNRPAPYVLGNVQLPAGSTVDFYAVGGVGLERRDSDFSSAVASALASGKHISVRDHRTRSVLASLGVSADLEPDPVMGLASWLKKEIFALPPLTADYVAVQCAASFGDDASLAALAFALNARGQPVVAFRAGAAPWHDDLEVLERLVQRLQVPARVLDSLHVRDICSAIGHAKACLASSLHALLVARLFEVPAFGIESQAGEGAKIRAYAETWGNFQVFTLDEVGDASRSQRTL